MKKFLKTFKWGVFFPALLLFVCGIVLLSVPVTKSFVMGITVGVLFTLSGVLAVLYFFLGREENVGALLAGVCQLSVALWLFISSPVPMNVFGIAIGVILLLRATAIVLEAVKRRKEWGWKWIVHLVVAAAILACGVVAIVNPFDTRAALIAVCGACVLVEGALSGVHVALSGFFEEEEELKFKPVKK